MLSKVLLMQVLLAWHQVFTRLSQINRGVSSNSIYLSFTGVKENMG